MDDAHERLRKWYLAYLRRTALAEEVLRQATPATLIGADEQAIKKIAGISAAKVSTAAVNRNNASRKYYFVVLLVAAAVWVIIQFGI